MLTKVLFKYGISACFLFSGLAGATSIFVGSDGAGPVQVYGTDGTLLGVYGSADGTAAAEDGVGGLFIAIPDFVSSTVEQYGPSEVLLNSFSFTAPGDARTDAPYIIDLAWGHAGTLWVSTFTGEVYHLAADGTVLSSFDTGTSSPGIAFDGVNLYTTSGPGLSSASPFVYQRDTTGLILNTIDTGLNDTLGVGFDLADSTLWLGGFDVVSHVDFSGTVLQSFAIDGIHYGVDASTPEPSTWILILTGVAGLGGWKRRKALRGVARRLLLAASIAPIMHAAVTITSLTPSPASPQPVGQSITLTTVASDGDAGALRYRFRIQAAGGAWETLADYQPSTSVIWTPTETDGIYQIEVSVRNRTTSSTQAMTTSFTVSARPTGATPVVNTTSHPLIALYSAPSCALGSSIRVRFKLATDVLWQSTALKACNGSTTMNFYVAGMRASSNYQLRQDVITGPRVVTGPTLTFNTGTLGQGSPSVDAILTMKPPSSTNEPVTLFTGITVKPYAVDASLQIIWYATTTQFYMTRPVPGGGYLVTFGFTTDLSNSGLRQYDLVGNLVKQTTVERINDQLPGLGLGTVTAFHHEIRKLANGNYMLLAQRELASTVQGPPNDISGDMILVLDNNLQLLWGWDSTAHLDLTRAAVLGETCFSGQCILFNAAQAHDWTHGNSAALTPDGNIVYSSRHQDMAYKISYANGLGDGHVIWKLGKDGDFTWLSGDPFPWFSHQHDIEYEDLTTLTVIDDGNTRVQLNGGNSRGQVLQLDEVHLTVTPLLNVDLGGYSPALGSAQRLINGNYVFANGTIANALNTQVSEWTAAGVAVANTHSPAVNYRSFRLRDLYSAPY